MPGYFIKWIWASMAAVQRVGIQLPRALLGISSKKARSRARSGLLQCRVGRLMTIALPHSPQQGLGSVIECACTKRAYPASYAETRASGGTYWRAAALTSLPSGQSSGGLYHEQKYQFASNRRQRGGSTASCPTPNGSLAQMSWRMYCPSVRRKTIERCGPG